MYVIDWLLVARHWLRDIAPCKYRTGFNRAREEMVGLVERCTIPQPRGSTPRSTSRSMCIIAGLGSDEGLEIYTGFAFAVGATTAGTYVWSGVKLWPKRGEILLLRPYCSSEQLPISHFRSNLAVAENNSSSNDDDGEDDDGRQVRRWKRARGVVQKRWVFVQQLAS